LLEIRQAAVAILRRAERNQMSRRAPSLWQFLEHHVHGRDNGRYLALFREQLDQSELLTTMERIADAVNEKARDLLIDVQSYLPPEALVRSFSFHKDNEDYVLPLESWGPTPTVVFLRRKWRVPLFLNSFGWIYRLFGVEEYVIEVSYSSLFRTDLVTEANIEKWFTYLISGFDRAFAPSVPLNDGIPAARQLGKQTAPIAEA
jgi:hypothetical protein